MAFDYHIIIGVFIFLALVRITIWILSNHRFQSLVFICIYLIAISPNLTTLFSAPFALDQFIMAFFDSIFIYILFSIYLALVTVMLVIQKGWLAKRGPPKSAPNTDHKVPQIVQLIMREIEKDS